jgi:competence protein ComEC
MFGWAIAFCAGAAGVLALPDLGPAAVAALPAAAAFVLARLRRLAGAACAGFACAHLFASFSLADGWPCARDREAVTVTGRVAAPALEREGRTDFDLAVTDASTGGPLPRRVRVAWYEADRLPRPGEIWRLELRLRCRRGFVNPGTQDRELALLRERIDATATVVGKSRPERIAGPDSHPVERVRARVAGAIAEALPPGPSVAVLQGLSVGVRGTIPDALWEAFAVTGVAHLMAISGLHVTGCAIVVLAVVRLAWRLPACARLPARLALESAVVTATTGAYAFLAGGSVPALRTLAMVAIFVALRVLRRAWALHQALALAALVLVAADPLALASAGFWLSFAATAALVAAAGDGRGWRARIVAFARGQAAVTTLLAPVLALSFGRLSVVAPLVNAAAIPLFSILLLPAVLAGTVVAAVEPGFSWPFWRALAGLLDRTWPVLENIAAWPGASWAPAAQPAWLVAATAAALLAALLLPLAGLRCAALVLLAAVLFGRPERPAEGAFALSVLDVGQGLAVVVETARHVLVFDAGPAWQGGGTAARVAVLPYLRARGIRAIDRLVLSHDDRDHAGGAEALRAGVRVARTMTAPDSRLAGDDACRRGVGWRWDGVAFRVLHPPAGFAGSDNDRACAIAVSGPGGTALLLADPEAAAEAELRSQGIAADVVLLPHHGSRSSSSSALVAAISPRVGIASAGYGNRWGMPVADVVARWRDAGSAVLTTAEEGAIRARFPPEPGTVDIETERRRAPHWWRSRPTD